VKITISKTKYRYAW